MLSVTEGSSISRDVLIVYMYVGNTFLLKLIVIAFVIQFLLCCCPKTNIIQIIMLFLVLLPHALTHGLFFGWFEGPLTVI